MSAIADLPRVLFRNAIPTLSEQKVRMGARFLDRKMPDWYRKIDVDSLDVSNSNHCIFGQLYGNYTIGVETSEILCLGPDIPVVFGFSTKSYDWKGGYKELTSAWKVEVNNRRRVKTTAKSDTDLAIAGD